MIDKAFDRASREEEIEILVDCASSSSKAIISRLPLGWNGIRWVATHVM